MFASADGGFDVILGNPPWERIKIQEKEWFAVRQPDIAAAPNAAVRRRRIAALQKDAPALFDEFVSDCHTADAEGKFFRASARYPLTASGDVNTYALFAESATTAVSSGGRVGIIVPTGVCTDDSAKMFFGYLVEARLLVSLFDFENKCLIFPDVHPEQKFCLLTVSGVHAASIGDIRLVFFAHAVEDLRQADRQFTLTPSDFSLLNPNTRTCPVFRSKRDAHIVLAIYKVNTILVRDALPAVNPWGISFLRMLDMANDSASFVTSDQLSQRQARLEGNHFAEDGHLFLPLYEGKLTHIFNHRHATFDGVSVSDLRRGIERPSTPQELRTPAYCVTPRYWVAESVVTAALGSASGVLSFHRIANPNNERSAVFSILPRTGASDSLFLILGLSAEKALRLAALGNSFAFDYLVRCKVGSRNLSYFVLKQIASPPPSRIHDTWYRGLLLHALELTYTSWDLQAFARDCGYDGPPFKWDEARRFLLRCELDAACFHLYGIARNDVDYIMDTFPIVKRKDEENHKEYRTKRVILEIYDAMDEATKTGKPYETRLDPLPADPRVAHPTKTPVVEHRGAT